MELSSFEVDWTAGISVLSKIEQSEKLELLTPNPMQSQETSNSNIVANSPNFLTVSHALQAY
jgi:hypothetical protein